MLSANPRLQSAISKIPAAFRGVPPVIRHTMPLQFPAMSASGSFAGAGSSFFNACNVLWICFSFLPIFGRSFSFLIYTRMQ